MLAPSRLPPSRRAGRGRRRGGRRGGGSSGGRPGWFLHDDRDEPAPGSAVGGGYGQQEEDAYEGVDPAFFSSAGDGITVRISRKGGREVSDTTGEAHSAGQRSACSDLAPRLGANPGTSPIEL